MNTMLAASCALLITGSTALAENTAQNILADIPYTDSGIGKRQLVDEKHLLLMQVALKPGQQVPQHNANSNVHLLIVEGQVVANLDGKDITASKGDLVPVAFKTPMKVRNDSRENASFLIMTSPNPSEMEPNETKKPARQ